MPIAIVTDSTADIPPDILADLNISVIPCIVIIGEEAFEDGQGISRHEFYERLPAMGSMPTTAAPPSGVFEQLYESLLAQGFDQVVSLHAPGRLSGIFNSARLAAEPFYGRVHVLDSGQTSMGLGFQVIGAAEVARGEASLEEILAHITNLRQRVRVLAMLDSLEYLRRSGRVSWMQANLGSLLSLKLFIELREGKVIRRGQARTRKKGIESLMAMIRELGSLERLAVLHTNAEADARDLLGKLNPNLSYLPLVINVTTVIGTHVGPKGVGCAAILAG